MPKFAGVVAQDINLQGPIIVRRMLKAMEYPSKGHSESEVHSSSSAAFGWTRRQAEHRAASLTWTETKDVFLMLLGDVHLDPSTFTRLKANGHQFPANDPGVLVHDYEDRGLKFLDEINGRCRGILWDRARGLMVLFNDRYGMARVYFTEQDGILYFASEAKALLAVSPGSRRFDPQSVAEYVSLGCPLQNRTLFEAISLLPGGSQWICHQDGRVEKRRYFDPSKWEGQERLPFPEYAQRLKETLGAVVPRYIGQGRSMGMSLTGGLDSRIVMAWADPLPGSLPCYTFGGPYRDCADVRIARKVAKACNQEHTTIRVEAPFFEQFIPLAEETVFQTDGAVGVFGAAELYVNRHAAQIAPVRLTGNYGTEILRSNIAFRPRKLHWDLYPPEFRTRLKGAEEIYKAETSGNRLSFIAFKQVPWYHYALYSLENLAVIPRSPFLDDDLVRLAYQAPVEFGTAALIDLIHERSPALASLWTDRAIARRSYPIITPLAKARQEFTVKAEYAYDYGMPDWLVKLDRYLAPLRLEHLFLGHHKFSHFRVWYRKPLGNAVREIGLGAADDLFCFHPNSVKQMIEGHLAGHSNRTTDLHKLLTLQLVDKLLLRKPWGP